MRTRSLVVIRNLVVILSLTGETFSGASQNLQFRRVTDDAVSIHFNYEVTWESSARVSVDMARIKHLLWPDNKVTLTVRVTDNSYQPLSDWSAQFILADDEAACGVVTDL